MGDTINFDYYYGIEAEQFSFYRVPRLLIKDERFKGLSSDAKLLYGLMLDRMSLSMKNGWLDDENRAYLYGGCHYGRFGLFQTDLHENYA